MQAVEIAHKLTVMFKVDYLSAEDTERDRFIIFGRVCTESVISRLPITSDNMCHCGRTIRASFFHGVAKGK
jgi:hypothetical protein